MQALQPLIQNESDMTQAADLVIVGLGAAGAAAAIEAAKLGLEVLVIERASACGSSGEPTFFLRGGLLWIPHGGRRRRAMRKASRPSVAIY